MGARGETIVRRGKDEAERWRRGPDPATGIAVRDEPSAEVVRCIPVGADGGEDGSQLLVPRGGMYADEDDRPLGPAVGILEVLPAALPIRTKPCTPTLAGGSCGGTDECLEPAPLAGLASSSLPSDRDEGSDGRRPLDVEADADDGAGDTDCSTALSPRYAIGLPLPVPADADLERGLPLCTLAEPKEDDDEGFGMRLVVDFGDVGGVAKGRDMDDVELLRDDVPVVVEPVKAGAIIVRECARVEWRL
ncbi:hypothetical protein CspHIS471_0103380 [Cutaneotrichosporon sp. HIS471]|nr:hypothetical protein CspHIS471_0103380 [Cutaneotrichosporon sp. HIS471]